MPKMDRRVVVTGVGCVTPLGAATDVIWQRLTEGRSGVGPLTLFDPAGFPVRIAAEIRDWDLWDVGENPRLWQHCPRHTRFAIGAGLKAGRQAGLPTARIDPVRMGIYLGCGEAFVDFDHLIESISQSSSDHSENTDDFERAALRIFDPDAECEYEPNMPAGHLASLFDAQGPNYNCIAACVSSTQAIGEAARLIRQDDADVMLAGGAHSMIHPLGLTGFQRLGTLSMSQGDPTTAIRPFDQDRDGFVIGEGGAVFVLEELNHARRRGADIWGEVSGYGSSQDAFRVTDTHPDGRGIVTAIDRAFAAAELNREEIDYINAHGTGTVLNDKIETLAMKRIFGERAYRIPISSTKSMMGHATTACGAIEAAVCLLAIKHNVAPPTINYETPDPDCDLDYVPKIAREISCNHVLSNSIGFGGQNAALILSRFDEASPAAARRAA